MKCEFCNKKHTGKYGSGRFCCETCARSFVSNMNRKEKNLKISKSLLHNNVINICKYCKNKFEIGYKKRKQKFCSVSCGSKYNMNLPESKEKYSKIARKTMEKINNRSKNEIYFAKLCKDKFKNILLNKRIFNGWDADVIINDLKIAILWNGRWHYEKLTKKHSVKQVQNRDKIKIKEIKNKGYIPYVIKDLGSYDKIFVKKEFDRLCTSLVQRLERATDNRLIKVRFL